MPPSPPAELPFLDFSSLTAGREFTPRRLHVGPELVTAFSEITGDRNPLYHDPTAARAAGLPAPVVPPGLAGVWARLAYLAEHRMPPGGVMAGQRLVLRGTAPVGTTLDLGARVAEQDPDDPKRRVLLACSARDDEGAALGEVWIDARWPAEED